LNQFISNLRGDKDRGDRDRGGGGAGRSSIDELRGAEERERERGEREVRAEREKERVERERERERAEAGTLRGVKAKREAEEAGEFVCCASLEQREDEVGGLIASRLVSVGIRRQVSIGSVSSRVA